jgi:hypothetical protein
MTGFWILAGPSLAACFSPHQRPFLKILATKSLNSSSPRRLRGHKRRMTDICHCSDLNPLRELTRQRQRNMLLMHILKFWLAASLLLQLTAGCSGPLFGTALNVPLADFSTKPAVEIDWPEMSLTIPPSNATSEAYVSPKVKIDGSNVIIVAKYVLSQRPATTTFDLRKLGLTKEKASSAKAFWINPDGMKIELELKKISGK